jgi:YD repeat-containing protein
VTEQSPNPSTEPNHVTTYTYDLLGHLIQAQMPRTINGQVITQTRTWTYNTTTQLLSSTTTPEAGTAHFTYNSDGTLATKTDAKNQQIQYTYDAYGRIIQISRGTVSNGQFTENVAQRTTLAYDGTNGGFSSNTLGRVSQVNYSGPHGLQFTEMYSYHPAGRPNREAAQRKRNRFGREYRQL